MTMFIKPTIEEVTFQFQVKGCDDELAPQQFFAYYESNGWHVGKSKMIKWKAAVAGWILRTKKYNNGTNQKGNTADTFEKFRKAFAASK